MAVFDMEGTIITSNVVESYVWTRMADLEPDEWPAELASVFGRIPGYLQIDRRDRGDFLRTFFRRYEGASVEGIDRLVEHHVGEFMLQKASAARDPADARASRGRPPHDADHRGGRAVHAPAGATVRHRDRRRAGGARRALHGVHVGAAARRRGPRRLAEALRPAGGRRPEAVVRVRGSYSDLPLLRAVGNPVAVSPDSSLYRYARRRRWPIEEWAMSKGMPRVRFPRPAAR